MRVTILQTSDLHGHLLPWDYYREREDDRGLARVVTRVRQIRKENPNTLLLDAGDTIQGSPLAFLHARRADGRKDPMAEAMSAAGYDAMAVGNHEFNFGLGVLRKAESESRFPWLSANTRKLDGSPAFPEYLVKTVGGVRIGILGLTTPNVPGWEPEPNRAGLKWEDPPVTARRLVPLLRGKERCDFVVVLIHSGPEIDLQTGVPDGTGNENRVAALAREVPGIDLLLTGHTHRQIPLTWIVPAPDGAVKIASAKSPATIGSVPVIQPGAWGDVLARVDVTFQKQGTGYTVASLTGELLPSSGSVAADPEIVRIAEPYDRAARAYLDEDVAEALEALPAERARLQDTPLLDLINDTQLEASGADLSITSLLPGGRYAGLPKGVLKVRDVFQLYPYENQLVMVEIDGATLKACLEHAAEFYGQASFENGRLLLKPKAGMISYNFDVLQGASYHIDPAAPVGSRVSDLRVKGKPVAAGDRFTMAVNSYRAQGGGGYTMLKGARIVKVFADEIRDLLIDRMRRLKKVEPRMDENWVLAPRVEWSPDSFSSRAH